MDNLKIKWEVSKFKINWWIFGIAVFFNLMESNYFGWNSTPHSVPELICDGISLIILAIAFLQVGVEVKVS